MSISYETNSLSTISHSNTKLHKTCRLKVFVILIICLFYDHGQNLSSNVFFSKLK